MKQRYDLELDKHIHWKLVGLAAQLEMDYETYAESVLEAHVKQKLDNKTKDLIWGES